jgi:hypothetical protein
MKKNTIINLICTVFAAMFLLSSCSIEYRENHRRHYDNHDSYHHDNHDNDHHDYHDSDHR